MELAERQTEGARGEEIGDQTPNERIGGMEMADQGQPPAPNVDAVQVMTE